MSLKHYIYISICLFLSFVIYDHFFNDRKTVIINATPHVQLPQSSLPLIQNHLTATPVVMPNNISGKTQFVTAAKKVIPSVVSVQSITRISQDEWERNYATSSGSGVILSSDGYIVTNMHVVNNENLIMVTLVDNREYEAKIVGVDPSTDVAIIKIEAQDLEAINFSNSDDVQVGEWVLAVGNPLRLQSTVTAGIVSAKARDINLFDTQYGIESFIQTDAAVNQGNSGGALVDIDGNLIGLNTAIITNTGRFEGYSFAIPSNIVFKVFQDIKEYGIVMRGLLGIEASNVHSSLAKAKDLNEVSGIYIEKVIVDGGAYDAELQQGDIVTKINDKKIESLSSMMEYLATFRPGEVVTVTYIRHGQTFQSKVVLKNKMNNTELVSVNKEPIFMSVGIEVRDLLKAEKRSTGVEGVKVMAIYENTLVSRTKMDPGFIITKFNEIPVMKTKNLATLIRNTKGRIVLEGIYENQKGSYWYVFER